ncbi:aldo/keto reductase [candidate division KSB1 bacterium]
MKESRRDFIKKSMIGFAGLSVSSLDNLSCDSGNYVQQERKVIKRTLGKTGLETSILGMGVVDNSTILPIVYDSGVNFIFTSGNYRNGMPEREIGRFLRDKPRDSFIITDGVGHDNYIDPVTLKFTPNFRKEMILEHLEESLERLGFDYIDIYCLGNLASMDTTLHEPFLEVMTELKNSGRIRFIGGTTHRNEDIVLRAAADSNIYDIIITAYNFRKANADAIRDAIAYAAGKGLGIVAMKTQAGVYWDSDRKNKINMKASLKWVLQDENVHTCIPSFSNLDEFEEDLSIMEDLTLTPAELEDLKIKDSKMENGLFCQQCGECLAQCSNCFNIPAVMRSYMYAFGYGDIVKAKETLRSIDFTTNPCTDCESCIVDCSMGFDIRKKVFDIIRINEA